MTAWLSAHPRVTILGEPSEPGELLFSVGTWQRSVKSGWREHALYGLPELMDNNPLVCADHARVPTPAATLALVCLGPLARAGMIADPPVVISSSPDDEIEIVAAIASVGYEEGCVFQVQPADLGGCIAVTCLAEVPNLNDWDEIDALYEEAYGRSYYVRRDEESEWDASLVRGRPGAVFRLRLSEDEPSSLISAVALADLGGKAGAAQLVHTMNLMCGFEETLGLD